MLHIAVVEDTVNEIRGLEHPAPGGVGWLDVEDLSLVADMRVHCLKMSQHGRIIRSKQSSAWKDENGGGRRGSMRNVRKTSRKGKDDIRKVRKEKERR
jgi:hypothetical protein